MDISVNLQPYPAYKPSGVDWLGDVPTYWRGSRLRYLADITTGERDTFDREDDGKYPFFVCSQTVERINTWSFDEEAVLTAGDGHVGKIFHYIDGKFDFHQRVYKFSNFRNVTGKFFFHYIKAALLFELLKGTAKTTVESIRLPMLKDFPFVIPPFAEQRAITRYLDHVERRIQRYIEGKEQLIALLQEARQAIIQRAVTRGLDPGVPLKPSGVDWLGDVPAHWEVRRLRYLAHITTGERDTIDRKDDGNYPFFVRSQNVERIDTWSFDGEAVLTAGDGVGVGRVFHYVDGKFDFHQRVYKFSNFRDVIGKFFFHYFRSTLRFEVLQGTAKSTVDSLRLPMLQNLPVVLPPLSEQIATVAHLDQATAAIDSAIDNARRQAERMAEYRASLIAHVVTGKVDVRAAVSLLQEAPEQESPVL